MKLQRTELSKRNPYYLPRHRYLELKHFCLQYDDWKKAAHDISMLGDMPEVAVDSGGVEDPVSDVASKREWYLERIGLVERVAKETDRVLSHYILMAVTSEVTYENLRTVHNIPICRNAYYELYRKFFYILAQFR